MAADVILVLACPGCLPGRQARARVIESDFWTYLGVALVPFLLTLLAIYAVHLMVTAADRAAAGPGR